MLNRTRSGLTHRHERRSRVRSARRGVVLWMGDAFRDAIERARRQFTAVAPRDARALQSIEPRGASPDSSPRINDVAHRSSHRPRRDNRPTARRRGRVSRSAGAPQSTLVSVGGTFTGRIAAAALVKSHHLPISTTAFSRIGTRFSAAARVCPGKRRRRRFDGALHAARDSHRVRRATSHPKARVFVNTQHPRARTAGV